MKRILFCFVICISQMLAAQSYEPTTTWPYLNEEFEEGELVMINSASISGRYNIHLSKGKLHYIDGELVKEAQVAEVFSVRIGQNIYANVQGSMKKVLAKSDKGLVVEDVTIDVVSLNSTGGAYGSSSNTLATQALSSIETMEAGSSNMNHMNMKTKKEDGKLLPLNKKIYLYYNSKLVYAQKKDVMLLEGIDKDELKMFIKKNKVKFNKPETLLLLIDFLSK